MLFYGKSDVGVVRDENQDSFGITELLPGVTLAVVCDGMGGCNGGSVASRLALDTFTDMMRESLIPDDPGEKADLSGESIKRALRISAGAANKEVYKKAKESPEGRLDGMGTTLVGILSIGNEEAYCINIGDSRLYSVSEAFGMVQVSHDHSLVQQMIDNGDMSPEQAAASPVRHMITRAVGTEESVEADVKSVDLGTPFDGKRFLMLCSDGLYGSVCAEQITGIVLGGDPLTVKTERLVKAARNNGGPDNITVIIAEITD